MTLIRRRDVPDESTRGHGLAHSGRLLSYPSRFSRGRVRLRGPHRRARQDDHGNDHTELAGASSTSRLRRALGVPHHRPAADCRRGQRRRRHDLLPARSHQCLQLDVHDVWLPRSRVRQLAGRQSGRRSCWPVQQHFPALLTLVAGATVHATLAVSDVLISNNCQHHVQTSFLQVYPPGQYSPLFAPLSLPGCADQSLITMNVDTISSGP